MAAYPYNNYYGYGDDYQTATDENDEIPIGIVITNPPKKTKYVAGESFDKTDMIVEHEFPSGRREVTTNYTVYPDGALISSNTFVDISCCGFIARQRIYVEPNIDEDKTNDYSEPDNQIVDIKIIKNPTKRMYFEGEYFDPTGMEIVGKELGSKDYNIKITSYDISPKGPLTTESTCLCVKYKTRYTYLYISVLPQLNADSTNAIESFGLVDGVNAELLLATGVLRSTFSDVKVDVGALSFNIGHVYSKTGQNRFCGGGWNLNLHSTLKRFDDEPFDINNIGKDEVDFVYVDAMGARYAFDEVFYYIDQNNRRKSVERNEVTVDADGKLVYDVYGKGIEVIREFKTATGLTLSAQIDGVNGVRNIDQRNEEIVQLEQAIHEYESRIIELEYNINGLSMLEENSPYPSEELKEKLADCATYVINECINKSKSIDTCIGKVKSELYRLGIKKLDKFEPSDDFKYDENNSEYLEGTIAGLQVFLEELNYHIEEASRELQHDRRIKLLNLLYKQIQDYTKAITQKRNLFSKYELQAPVAYLTDEKGVSMCFNRYGELCGIVDGYGNQIIVCWEYIKTRQGYKRAITSVVGGEREIKLEYNVNNILSQITNYNGKTVKYIYEGGRVHDVIYSTGKRLTFSYNSYGEITSVIAPHVAQRADVSYAQGKVVDIKRYSAFDKLTDMSLSSSDYIYKTNEISVRYGDGRIMLQSDGKTKTVYLDSRGALAASSIKDEVGYIERPSYEYSNKNDNLEYTVNEVADAVWARNELINPSEKHMDVITADKLKKGVTDYVFSAEANKTTVEKFTGYSAESVLPFGAIRGGESGKKFRITAKVIQGDKTQEFYASFDASNDRAQYIALPVSLDKARLDGTEKIELYAECSSANVVFDNMRFAPAEWECREKDEFGNVVNIKMSEKQIAPGVYERTETTLTYDSAHKQVIKEVQTNIIDGTIESRKSRVTNYSYCEHGNLIKTESYIEGEEGTSGIDITERVCDDKGNVIKEFSYNSLDSSTKFYKESEYAENGTVTAELDETGENKSSIEYLDDGSTVKTRTLPDGSKLAYGRDSEGNVTSITQSTEDGESNSTETRYNFGSPTRLTSGNNTILYEYDQKRRKTKVDINGKITTYSYEDNASTEEVLVGSEVYRSVRADKVIATIDGNTFETFTDKRGNTMLTTVNGQEKVVYAYDGDGKILSSADYEKGSIIKFTYSDDCLRSLQEVDISAGVDVDKLTETYAYNEFGQIKGRAITGAVFQGYNYSYKDNAARDLDYIELPSKLRYFPQTDVNGRNIGRALKSNDGKTVYSEDIYYRKVGDHGTNMPSSVYFGKNKNGVYSISDNLKYKYDESGNISEIRENGILVAKYTYDKLGRIVREDNRKLNKTILWSYDNCGNILSKREAVYTLKATDDIVEFKDEKLYAYDRDRLLSFGGKIVSFFDEGGKEHRNPCDYLDHKLSWNYEQQLASFGNIKFTYDGYGRRITKTNTKGKTTYAYNSNNKLVKQSDGIDTLEFIYDNSGLSGVTYNGTAYIYCKDIQGNIVGILDSEGREVVQYAYDAWGNHAVKVLDRVGHMVDYDMSNNENAPDSAYNELSQFNPFRYRGYYYDTETKLYFLKTRYYDPEVGRFISQDDVSYLDPEHINGLNLYAYCGNNPVMRTDGNGNAWWHWLLGVLTVIAVAAATVLTVGAVGVAAAAVGVIASSAIGSMMGAAATGALIAGTACLISQAVMGYDTPDFSSLALNTFIGGVVSGFSAGIGGSTGVLLATQQHLVYSMAMNSVLSLAGYFLSCAVGQTDFNVGGLLIAFLGGCISGVPQNNNIEIILISLFTEMSGYPEMFSKIFKNRKEVALK